MEDKVEPASPSSSANGQKDAGLNPSALLEKYWTLFREPALKAPVVDLACGHGHNGLFLASRGIPVILIDRSAARLARAGNLARDIGTDIDIRIVDLEKDDSRPLPALSAGGMVVFRYLHRPLIPYIKDSLHVGAVLVYETFTTDQPAYGRPRNPDFLLNPGELKRWFSEWEVIHYFEGIVASPERAVAQIVCRKPAE